ncbi:proton-coupled amino acid transporter-like protein CG1139 [Daphnia pulicaria]|uniref:proton-coupled amino acid transporter-like protein CG1139 n=1 Tax=Daphnia pulicaria TaxID=35523 RepID=UPI001EE9D018|nr:proton-coupled amino acid transporter-like protein CG1139 [Daphnia pulicaria]
MVEKHDEDISSSDSNSTEIPIPLEDLSLNKNSQISQDAEWVPGQAITPVVKEQKKFQPISNFETMAHLLKGNIGTGIFAMPSAFLNSGIWVGSVLLPVMAIICTHCMQMLVRSAAIMKKREGDFSISYADVAETACKTSNNPNYAKYARAFSITINVFICITQFGFCCVYLVFTSTNLQQVVEYYTEVGWDVRIYMCFLAIPLIFLNWIRNLKLLAPVSLVANVLQMSSIVVVFYYIFRDPLPPVNSRPAFGSWGGLPLFFGTTVFTFEGIALVLPLQKDMRRPWDFKGWTGILNTGMVIVTCIYIAMGFYGYLQYGEDILGSITLNLPQDEVLAQVVKILLVIAICGNYAMQFYVPIPIMWPTLSKYAARYTSNDLAAEYMFRTFMVLVTLLLAAAIPKIDLFISLVGAFGSSFLALIFPPILEYVTYAPNISKITITKEILILLFGVIGFATGTYAAILAIVQEFSGTE